MALNIKDINHVTDDVRILVSGYIRRYKKLLPLENLYYDLNGHEIIMTFLALYYNSSDVFDVNGKSSFNFMSWEHNTFYHVFGREINKRHIRRYQWRYKQMISLKVD